MADRGTRRRLRFVRGGVATPSVCASLAARAHERERDSKSHDFLHEFEFAHPKDRDESDGVELKLVTSRYGDCGGGGDDEARLILEWEL
jgi:hypothetical protein